jgi:Protein of unknown function (DUF551)
MGKNMKNNNLTQALEFAAEGRKDPDPNDEVNMFWLVTLADEVERLTRERAIVNAAVTGKIANASPVVEALQQFVRQWNACGPNSDFGRYFANIRDIAVAALAKHQGMKESADEAPEMPAAWMRRATTPGGPWGPEDGNKDWIPLYRHPSHETSEWRPVEVLPEKDGFYWCYLSECPPQSYPQQAIRFTRAYRNICAGIDDPAHWWTSWTVSHWMPLRTPPPSTDRNT